MAKDTTRTEGEDGLEAVRNALRQEAEKAPALPRSNLEQVKALLPEIDALLKRRRTHAEIRDILAGQGIEMSLGTFRQYYARAKREIEGFDEGSGNAAETKSATKREPKVKPNANATANAAPKPSELAGSAPSTPGTGAAKLGHKLDDNDV